MAASFFTYNISRPWPFRWFTPVVLVGTVVFMVLFSLLNLVSTGYTLVVQYSDNPNATTSQVWFDKWPSFLTSKVRPTCQAVGISTGTTILTNNTALTYTLNQVSQNTDSNSGLYSPSLIYRNNLLTNCEISSLQVRLNSMDRTATQIALSRWGIEGKAFITCQVGTEEGMATFNMTGVYNYIPSTVSTYAGLYQFTGRNQTSSASLYWGESLLSMYWRQTTINMENALLDGLDSYTQGVLTFTPNFTSGVDMESRDLFQVIYRWVSEDGSIIANDGHTPGNLSAENTFPNIWLSTDTFVKALYSTVLADLGQSSSGPNILNNATLLQYYTANFATISAASTGFQVGPAQKDYNSLKASTGPLGIDPAVISSTYLCQSPHLKPAGDLIVAIFIADLVLLQALWSLFKLIMGIVVIRRDPEADYCAGHAKVRNRDANTAHPHIMGDADEPIELSRRLNLTPQGYSQGYSRI